MEHVALYSQARRPPGNELKQLARSLSKFAVGFANDQQDGFRKPIPGHDDTL